MGAAAEHRGNDLIRRQCEAMGDALRQREDAQRALQVAEDCNTFVTQAMSLIVEPKGLRQLTVERAKTRRGWPKRHAQLVDAHSAWVDVDSLNLGAYHSACVSRARAAYTLLVFALGGWTIPDDIQVPRAALQ